MTDNPFKLSLSNFLAAETSDPLQAPPSFTQWAHDSGWARELYEPEMLSPADARTTINYDGKPHSVINFCSYNYLGLANHPEVIAAAHEALSEYGMTSRMKRLSSNTMKYTFSRPTISVARRIAG